nr:hypothetical protein [Tanacetum cinerariifolium]
MLVRFCLAAAIQNPNSMGSVLIVVFAAAVLFSFVSGVADMEVAAVNVDVHGNIDGKYKGVDVKPSKVRRNVSIENIGNSVAAEQLGETQHVNDNATPIKGTNHVAADGGVFLDNFAGIKPDGADTNGGLNVDDVALHRARSDRKHAHGSPYNTGVKSFANMFNADCSKQKVNFRSLVNEEKVETFDTVLPWAAMDKVKHKYVNSLVGYFIGKNLAFHVVQNYVTNTWAKFGFEKLMKTDDGVFLFKFAAKTGMGQVLERGPWIIQNMPLILNKWTPSLSLKKDEVTKILVWVKMHKVPVVAYSEDGSMGRISFARALIEICSVSDLKKEVSIAVPNEDGIGHTREVIKVEYEWQPPRCTECKVFSHSHDKCLKRVNLETPSKNKDHVIPSNAGTHSDGFTEVKRKKNKGKKADQQTSRQIDGIRLNKLKPNFLAKKGTNVKGSNMDNSNKVNTPSISNSFDALNNMEEGASSSRNIQEDNLETGNTSQWNEDQESDNEVDEFIFPEGDKVGDKFDIRLKGRVRK